jgi:hypothetical protein
MSDRRRAKADEMDNNSVLSHLASFFRAGRRGEMTNEYQPSPRARQRSFGPQKSMPKGIEDLARSARHCGDRNPDERGDVGRARADRLLRARQCGAA